MMGCLYKIDSPSGKSYIGITLKTAENRFEEHCKDAFNKVPRVIHHAIRKYSKESLMLNTLLISDSDEYLRFMERKAISRYKTLLPYGYNMTSGGDGVYGPASDVTKRRIATFKKTVNSSGGKDNLRNAQLKVWSDLERRERHSEIIKKLWEDSDYRKHMSEAHKGNTHSESQKKKMASIRRKYWDTPGNREKRSIEIKKLYKNPEFVKAKQEGQKKSAYKISAKQKQIWSCPEYKEKMRAKAIQAHKNPDLIKRKSKTTKKQMLNPKIRIDIANKLSKYKDCVFRKTVLTNPFKRYGTLQRLWDHIPEYSTNKDLLRLGFKTREIDKVLSKGYMEMIK